MPRRRTSYGYRNSRSRLYRRMSASSRAKIYRRPGYRSAKRAGRLMVRVPTGVPNSTFVKLRYAEVVGASGISMAAPAHHYIRMNSLFDPQAGSDFSTVTGHSNNGQPMWRDQWANMYYQYRVYGCKIKVTWQPYELDATNAGTNTAGILVIYPSDNQGADGDIITSKERIGARYVNFGGAAFTTKINQVFHRNHPRRPLGYTSRQYTDDPATAGGLNSGSNPTKQSYWVIAVQNISTAQALYGYLQIEVEYLVRIFDRIEEVAAS